MNILCKLACSVTLYVYNVFLYCCFVFINIFSNSSCMNYIELSFLFNVVGNLFLTVSVNCNFYNV